ncbi:FUSC family protein [Pararhodobacter zhoushanensis]|uniref:FUSC family protein n=1 Tax=Pararhodobacter zhoushanensis TaxID=2479545 RepID=A0ABT3H1U6_9RHOB|nr:FUSC family protein [Pararhodobacter zhoushanensis]MCW1933757.1 FUSC family protein [Pararhodobacter zhoushanensis]
MTDASAQTLLADLAPRDGRLSGALTITGLVLVTSAIAMALRVPEAALSCYLIFFAHRDNAGDSIFTAIKLTIAASLGIFLGVLLLRGVIEEPMLRLAALVGFTFLGMFLSQASKLGPLAGTAGFVFAFLLTLADVIPVPELMNRALEWMWVVLALPLGLMAFWAALAGKRPLHCAEERITARTRALADPQGASAQALLDEGMGPLDDYRKFARMLGEARGEDAARLAYRADDSFYQLALAEAGVFPQRSHAAPPPEPVPFLLPNAFTDPRHVRFALKVSLAVVITYAFYTAFGLFQIHTAMITCFYVALGTRGETHHRIALRFAGAVMGAVAGFATMLWLMPLVDDIGGLLLLLAVPTFVAAWIGLGGERISYAGWQLALCFFLVVLTGFGPPTGIGAAVSRVIGILFGSAVIMVVFAVVWPDSARDDALAAIDEMDTALATAPPPRSGRDIARLRAPLAQAMRLSEMARYERLADLSPQIAAAKARYHAFLRSTAHAAA